MPEITLNTLETCSPYLKSLLATLIALTPPRDLERFLIRAISSKTEITYPDQNFSTWVQKITTVHLRRPHRRNVVDDGFFSDMAVGASFASILGIPEIGTSTTGFIPKRAIPFSKLSKAEPDDVCVFHEKDPMFADYLVFSEVRNEARKKVSMFASADCSLYRDMPFCLQIANTYINRLTAYDLQEHGLLHAPLCRWGDERTYEPYITDVPIAFIGLPKRSDLWIGTYGVSRKREDKRHLRLGIEAMIKWLEPSNIFVYGFMPKDVFGDLVNSSVFHAYPDWTSYMHGRLA